MNNLLGQQIKLSGIVNEPYHVHKGGELFLINCVMKAPITGEGTLYIVGNCTICADIECSNLILGDKSQR